MLKLYNTLARDKQAFVPIVPGKVRLYVCGMTVYDYCHLGHARVMVVFDAVARWLRESDYDVTYVRNITDIDDKIIKRAAENGESIEVLTGRFIQAMHEDADALGVARPDFEPKATEYLPGMVRMIRALVDKGLAYPASNGDVYYSVHRFPGYGKLSGKSLDDLRAGARVDIDEAKKDPLDFVLWKTAKPDEPQWLSPWGAGRPGWHIECSVMSEALLGEHFDIHGGGQDLQFPHHENEIAQSEGAHDHPFVNYWMHNGFVRVDDEKMSKSLGNFFTVREILEKFLPEVVRFFILRAHYRSPLKYSDHHLADARQSLTRLYTALKGVEATAIELDWDEPRARRFKDAMDDDFNTPEATAVLFEIANELNRSRAPEDAALLKALGGVLGLLQEDPVLFRQAPFLVKPALPVPIGANVSATGELLILTEDAIATLISARSEARKSKNYAEADRIRTELLDAGIVLEDKPGGVTEWRRA
jgi:cysteinyl-tRNA synthetase